MTKHPDYEHMVRSQIAGRGIRDPRVLSAMREIRRHEFVAAEQQAHACDDGPLPIGYGQTISQPYVVAWMSELLDLESDMKVLEIGTGCGYQTAVLAKLCAHVYSIERVEALSRQAAINLRRAGIRNVTLKVGDGYDGWPEYAPFPRILAGAAPDEIPPALLGQLAPGGILVAPVGPPRMQQMVRVRKRDDGTLQHESLGAVAFVPLVPGEQRGSG
ncbi:MAG: protein-L-isoaspartate(D-aspartate) O-methyltransferase [Planctomycetes bacterium]|nr:protein-L-isoaspartate(D-aspartate) O-methyltransferase [Planctomycetota bacterium]